MSEEEKELPRTYRRHILPLGKVVGGIQPSQEGFLRWTPEQVFSVDSLVISSFPGGVQVKEISIGDKPVQVDSREDHTDTIQILSFAPAEVSPDKPAQITLRNDSDKIMNASGMLRGVAQVVHE